MRFLQKLREANKLRQQEWPGAQHISDEFVGLEVAAEAGEIAGCVQKLVRHDKGIAGNGGLTREVLLAKLADEIGDVMVNLDRIATIYGVDVEQATANKFNKTSAKHGLKTKIIQ